MKFRLLKKFNKQKKHEKFSRQKNGTYGQTGH